LQRCNLEPANKDDRTPSASFSFPSSSVRATTVRNANAMALRSGRSSLVLNNQITFPSLASLVLY
jgi:hypothetical protein